VSFPLNLPDWMWLYFGAFGTAGVVLFIMVMWSWTKYQALVDGSLRSASRWNAVGYLLLFFAQWSVCGIGGPPGNMLSSDASTHNLNRAIQAATLGILFSVPGWVCLLVGQRKLLSGVRSAEDG